MNDEIEEVIEIVKHTDSQKSVATSNVYSMDFTDSSSDKHNSSGMETYVLEWDSECSDSPRSKCVCNVKDTPTKSVNLNKNKQLGISNTILKVSPGSDIRRTIVAQEIYTQTSKTIIELAENEGITMKAVDCNTLETQTSFLSISENKRVEYRIEMTGPSINSDDNDNSYNFNNRNIFVNKSYGGDSSNICQISKSASHNFNDTISPATSDKILPIINTASVETVMCDVSNPHEWNSDIELSEDNTDIEEDSLMQSGKGELKKADESQDTTISVNKDVAELYSKMNDSLDFQSNRSFEQEKKHFGHLTPLAEESVAKRESSVEMISRHVDKSNDEDKDVLFINNAGIKVKLFQEDNSQAAEEFRLPPIHSGHNYSNLDFLFTVNSSKHQIKSAVSTESHLKKSDKHMDRWEMSARELASGESPLISGRSDYDGGSHCGVQLPPIHLEGFGTSGMSTTEHNMLDYLAPEASHISIKNKIKELKISHRSRNWNSSKFNILTSRSGSPSSVGYDNKTIDTAERGCEILCVELLTRLRSTSWFEVTETLMDMPNILEKFWNIIPEYRIADLLRQVTAQVESPRTQIARAACNTLSTILIKTNYTKKPDFYEAVAMLLIKTGSFSRPVRRAANVALDNIVCAVHLSHVISVLCIHGATHKSPLVRCAAARLLVVCCALGGGGRALLRARPPSAATARRHALRSLAQLLDDKSTDTRKYAVRLYAMLRPLTNFEAYYLTDVNAELATTQIKKYDQLLLCSPEPR